MKDILKGAKFGDKFVCRNGDIALYLWTNNKEGYSLQLEKEKLTVCVQKRIIIVCMSW